MRQLTKGFKLLLKGAISVAFFAVLLSFVQANELVELFTGINWLYFALSIGLTPVMLGVSCTKWKLVLDRSGVSVPVPELFRYYFIGYFFSNILPSTVGGDLVRSYYAGKCINNQAYSAVAVFIERFTGILLLLLLVIVMPLIRVDLYKNPFVYIPAACALSLLVVIVIIGVAADPVKLFGTVGDALFRFLRWMTSFPLLRVLEKGVDMLDRIYQTVLKKVAKVHHEFTIASAAIKNDSQLLIKIVLLTVLFYLLTMVNVYVCYLTFNVKVNFLAVCVLVPVALFVAHLPVSLLGNLGYFESIFVGYFLLVGVPASESLAMGLLLRFKMLMLGLIGYGFYLTHKGDKIPGRAELNKMVASDNKQ